jgi:hypothetical protein
VLSHEIAYEIKSYLFIFEYFGWGIHLLSPVIRDPLLLRQGYVRKDLMFGQISFSYYSPVIIIAPLTLYG